MNDDNICECTKKKKEISKNQPSKPKQHTLKKSLSQCEDGGFFNRVTMSQPLNAVFVVILKAPPTASPKYSFGHFKEDWQYFPVTETNFVYYLTYEMCMINCEFDFAANSEENNMHC